VILPIQEFAELLEDCHDLAILAQRQGEETISHQDLIQELKQDGLLVGWSSLALTPTYNYSQMPSHEGMASVRTLITHISGLP
jgi:hypothetical protein